MEKELKNYLETIIKNQCIIESKIEALSISLLKSDKKIAESTSTNLNNLLKTSVPRLFEAGKKVGLKKKVNSRNKQRIEKQSTDYRR